MMTSRFKSSSSSSLSSIPRKKPRQQASTSGTNSSTPSRGRIKKGKKKKRIIRKKLRIREEGQDEEVSPPRKRMRITMPKNTADSSSELLSPVLESNWRRQNDATRRRAQNANKSGSSSSPLSTAPESSSSRRRRENAGNPQRRDNIQRFPVNPNQTQIDAWLQKNTANPYVKLSRKHMKRMRPCSNIYLKVAKYTPDTGRITRLLPGGTLTRNEYPTYCMLRGISNPKPFSVQMNSSQLYIRSKDKHRITEEYEKTKVWDAIQREELGESNSS